MADRYLQVVCLSLLLELFFGSPQACAAHKSGERGTDLQKFLLVHGATQGAFVWWKTIADLEREHYVPTAVDLLALGRDTTPTCSVNSIKKWATNAISYLQALPLGEKVILVVHSAGGVVGQYLSENFPEKLRAAVYVASVTPPDNKTVSSLLPTITTGGFGITYTRCDFRLDNFVWKSACQDCGDQYVKLLQLTHRPQPTLFYSEPVRMTDARSGSVRRFWIRTTQDSVVPPVLQDSLIGVMKPEKVYDIDSGHIPMMSANREFLHILLAIAKEVG